MNRDERGEAFGALRKANVPEKRLADAYRNFWLPAVKSRETTHAELLRFLAWAVTQLGQVMPPALWNVHTVEGCLRLRTMLGRFRKETAPPDGRQLGRIMNEAMRRAR